MSDTHHQTCGKMHSTEWIHYVSYVWIKTKNVARWLKWKDAKHQVLEGYETTGFPFKSSQVQTGTNMGKSLAAFS